MNLQSQTVAPEADVYLVSAGAAGEGHNARYLARISTRLQQNGVAVHAIVPTGSPQVPDLPTVFVDTGVPPTNAARFRKFGRFAPLARGVARLRSSHAFLRDAVRHAKRKAASGRPVIVHLLDYEYLTASLALAQIDRTPNLSAVVTVHPSNFSQEGWGLGAIYKRLVHGPFRKALQSARAVVCHGPWIRERLIDQLDLSPQRVHALYYPSEGNDARVDRLEACRALGLDSDKTLVLWFGMIRRNKRLDLAAAALARLPDDVHLVVAGRPAELTVDDIRSVLRENGVAARTSTFLDYIDEADIPLYFSAADVMLATHDPSFTSASGPISDARTYRLPVVATRAGQIAEYVSRFDIGTLPDTNSAEGFADALLATLATDSSIWRAKVDAAAVKLSWEEFADSHRDIYDAVAGES